MLNPDDLDIINAQDWTDEDGCALTVTATEDAPRVDAFLATALTHISRTYIGKVIRDGGASINGASCKPGSRVHDGDRVILVLPPLKPSDLVPQDIPLDVLHEDADLIVINKQKGLSAHPAPSCPDNTVVNALLHRYGSALSNISGEMRPGIVHRLDKDTSGVMLIARNNAAHQFLAEQFNARTTEKHYTAIAHGKLGRERGTITGAIGRDPHNRKRMKVVSRGGKDAVSEWQLTKEYAFFSIVDFQPHTGRTHQIRAHMVHIGHPLAGDTLYGGHKFRQGMSPDDPRRLAIQTALDGLRGQALHAASLAFNHPKTGERLTITAPLPPDMAAFIHFLENSCQLIVDS